MAFDARREEHPGERHTLMPQAAGRPRDQRLPPAINVIALTSFAASLSTRALDPVLPHVAADFGVSIATAAGFSAVYAFTFAIVQPAVGAAADLFGKARLMIVCLVLLGNRQHPRRAVDIIRLLFATRILAGIASGGVFPVALGLTSDLVAPDKRQVAIGRTLAGSMTGNLLGASLSGLIGDFLGWRGVLVVLGGLAALTSVVVAAGFRGAEADPAAENQPVDAQTRLSHHLQQSQRRDLLLGCVHRGLLRARTVSLHRPVPGRSRRTLAVDRGPRDRGICHRGLVLHAHGVALSAQAWRQGDDDRAAPRWSACNSRRSASVRPGRSSL